MLDIVVNTLISLALLVIYSLLGVELSNFQQLVLFWIVLISLAINDIYREIKRQQEIE